MLQRSAQQILVAIATIVLVSASGATAGEPTGPQDAEAIVSRLRELLNATESKRAVVAFPNSRSRILTADGNSDFFLYIERGNLRGTETIDAFYQQLDAGDVDGAYETFARNSLVSMRISDFGWNGLGVPMSIESGSEIQDRFFKNTEGVFGAAEVTPEDAATYLEFIRDILIPGLEGSDSR